MVQHLIVDIQVDIQVERTRISANHLIGICNVINPDLTFLRPQTHHHFKTLFEFIVLDDGHHRTCLLIHVGVGQILLDKYIDYKFDTVGTN